MEVKVRDSVEQIKFTYNSFKYMKDFNIRSLEEISEKPFMMIQLCGQILLGGINHDRNKVYSLTDVDDIIERSVSNGTFTKMFTELVNVLTECDFFKSLQQMDESEQ